MCVDIYIYISTHIHIYLMCICTYRPRLDSGHYHFEDPCKKVFSYTDAKVLQLSDDA